MPGSGKELSAIDFAAMIGGPLVAVINAQSQAASATLNFIRQVGFEGEHAASIPFQYKKSIQQKDGSTDVESVQLSVPILSLLPVPFIRIQEANIEFRAKVVGVYESEEETTEEETGRERAASQSSMPVLRVAFSHRNRSALGADSSRSYSMNVRIRAVQDELPIGLERLLTTLESHIQEQPSPSEKPPYR